MRHSAGIIIDITLIILCIKLGIDFLLDKNYPTGLIYVLFAVKTTLNASYSNRDK